MKGNAIIGFIGWMCSTALIVLVFEVTVVNALIAALFGHLLYTLFSRSEDA